MKLNVRALEKRGIAVEVIDPEGREIKSPVGEVRVYVEIGTTPVVLIDAIKELVRTQPYQDIAIDKVAMTLSRYQVIEAIEATEDEDA